MNSDFLLPVSFLCYFLNLSVYLLLGLMKEGYYLAFSRVKFPSLYWCFPPIIFCRTGFVERYWVNLVLSWNILVD